MTSPASFPASRSPFSKTIAVIGAGITGLAAAHRLSVRGHRVRVFEQSNRTGGAIRTDHVDGWLVEAGPASLESSDPALPALFAEIGLAQEVLTAAPAARRRFVVRLGRAAVLPDSIGGLLRSPYYSPTAKLRALAELFERPRIRTTDLSLDTFFRSHFGQELTDYYLDPLVGGLFAGDPRKLSARHAFPEYWDYERRLGSIARGHRAAARARRSRQVPESAVMSFARGLQALPLALADRLPAGSLTLGARLECLLPGRQWNVVWNDGTSAHTETFDAVIAALPATGLAALRFGTLGERPLAGLDSIVHPPLAALYLGYRRDQVAHPLDGEMLLAPAAERRAFLAVRFSSSVFPGRAPAGHVALTVLAGGTRRPELAALPPDRLLAAVQGDLAGLLGVKGDPVFMRHNVWTRSIPQYDLGYERHLEAMTACERAYPGLWLGGQARTGVAPALCLAAGEALAARAVPA